MGRLGAQSLQHHLGREAEPDTSTPATQAQDGSYAPSAGPLSFVLLVPSVICGYLAHWQYERSIWKVGTHGPEGWLTSCWPNTGPARK